MSYSDYKSLLKQEYPSAYEFVKEDKKFKPLLFAESVPLPSKAYEQMSAVVKTLFQLKQKKKYQKTLSTINPFSSLKNQKQDSVLMAYDFHLQEGIPKLIEVNTNASAFLIVNSFYQFQGLPYKKAQESLKKSFQTEWKKFKDKPKPSAPKQTLIIDENPYSQKMIAEFFMYKDFFKRMGWPAKIYDSGSLISDKKACLYTLEEEKVDFIYNRTTDFYFENHPHLAQAYEQKTCAFSPNPVEYYLLSDKRRLCDWAKLKNQQTDFKNIKQNLLFSEILNLQNKDRIWKTRKKYFFKNLQGYGGKRVYKGASLSRKKFEELYQLKSLVQTLVSPSLFKDSKDQEWKTDFRLYVYEDQIQQIAARCYQGQLTNFQKEGSGFAPVRLV